MLSPDDRSLVTTLLTPPCGMLLDAAIATTYTLDPVALLTVPLHLAWLASGEDKRLLGDGIRLFEALRRVGEKLTVYTDRGRIQAPEEAHPLYGLLESMIVEVRAPRGGAFHPKIWALRFVTPDAEPNVCIRLAILSRNLTADRSWDLSLLLEGAPGGSYIATNREIGELVRDLPSFAVGPVPEARADEAARLGDEIRRTYWELPTGWDKIRFHVLGRKRRAWSLPESKHLAVVSPFVTDAALAALCKTSKNPVALVSRSPELAALAPATRALFDRCLVLEEAAESEDGEDSTRHDTLGLHAKALVLRSSWDTRLFVGSANATSAAMLNSMNIEVLAELVGKSSKVGCVEELLGSNGFGGVLTDFDPATTIPPENHTQIEAEAALDAARCALADAALSVHCDPHAEDWRLSLRTAAGVEFGDVEVHAWPLSLQGAQAVAASGLEKGLEVDLGVTATADVTGLTGFVLRRDGVETRFALNLPLENPPADRDGALVRRIVHSQAGFLRYLLLLLGDPEGGEREPSEEGKKGRTSIATGGMGPTLLEEMVRAFAHDRARLADVKRIVERLQAGEAGNDVVPPEFLAVWKIFLQAMEVAA